MVAFLLDEQISPKIVMQVSAKREDIPIYSIHDYTNGAYLGVGDEIVLTTAASDGLTLITYDQKTIPLILVEWGQARKNHAGVIFIDNRSIPANKFGALVKAIIWLYDRQKDADWQNRIIYLQPIS